jgi:serine/threonine protein kinase/tetratricopeptide (TPR) repeat protein
MAGATIGHYRVIEELGSGDGGVVYLAEDLRLHREVAIKVPRADRDVRDEAGATGDFYARFRREAHLACSLSHPNICTVHDVAEDAGRPFIVLERLHGSPLDRLLESGPIALRTALGILADVSDALGAVHARGIVHGAVIPANVFVTTRGQAKLLDFGTATTAERGLAAGAPAPAAAQGQGAASATDEAQAHADGPEAPPGGPPGWERDLEALGALLHEMVTGRPAPADGHPVGQRGMPSELEAVVRRALARDASRGGGVASVRDAIEAYASRRTEGRLRAFLRPRASIDSRSRRSRVLASVAVVAAVAGLGAWAWSWWRRPPAGPPLSDRDSVLIGAFTNTTGETVFDDTLRHALAVHLSQSPFLSVVGDDRIGETLRLMGIPATSQVTPDLSREVCERVGARASIEGSIAPRAGGGYSLALVAVACHDGQTLARQSADAARREDVLGRLGRAASALRGELGESLPSIRRFDVPIERATTASLEALRSYTLGVQARARGRESESIPHFERAIAIDPHFASAYNMLSLVYGSAGDAVRGAEYGRRAFEASEGVSERERLLILFQYHDRVTGDLDRVVSTLRVWEQSYPRDFSPSNALALVYNRIGQFGEAAARGREAHSRNPDHPFPYSNLAYAYRGLNEWREARQIAEQAVERGIATMPTRRLLYQLALLDDDPAAAERQMQAVRGRDREFDLVGAHAQALAFAGRRRAAIARYDEARGMADRGRFSALAAGYALQAAWTELLFGYPREAVGRAAPLLTSGDAGVRLGAATVLALAGRPAGVAQVADAALAERPEDTLTVSVSVPMVRAALALARGDAPAAVEALEPARPYDVGRMAAFAPAWLRATAHLRAGNHPAASEEFGRVLGHRGTDPFSIYFAVAPLGRARSLAAAGRRDEALESYGKLLAQWRDADTDLVVAREARAEAARLRPAAAAAQR